MSRKVMSRKVAVTERAVEARINRVLAKELRVLKRCREDSRWFRDLGRHYIVDLGHNGIAGQDVDIELLGRELGVLKDYEVLAEG